MIEIEIDGKKIEVKEGTMLIEAADSVGIKIPRFCYHKKLSIAANCRMCLVNVMKAPKPLPACATPVTSGMVVNTQNKEAIEAQKSVMEFLLINHPLDCPICDQGGECELQDVAMGYGSDVTRFNEGKRSFANPDIGPLIATEMTRCIQCTRCVRFGTEIAGLSELGTLGRGEHTEIGTYIQKHLKSEMSGNVIDLCPVGALTSKPFRFKARPWELEQHHSVAPHDCVGSNVYVHTRQNKVMRVIPKENESINETWLSDRDRFGYLGLYEDRVTTPMMKTNGAWQETDWKTALNFAATGLQKVIDGAGASQVGALISPSATTEECFLLQKLFRALGSHHIDFRIQQEDFSDQGHDSYLPSTILIEQIENQKNILLIGSNIRYEQPIIHHRIRKASLKNANIMSVNPVDFDFRFVQQHKAIVKPYQMVTVLAGIAKLLLANAPKEGDWQPAHKLVEAIEPTKIDEAIAKQLTAEGGSVLILGALALNNPHASSIKALSELIVALTGVHIMYLPSGANPIGAWLAGAIPHRSTAHISVAKPGLSAKQMWQSQLKAFVLFGVEPELDCQQGGLAKEVLKKADFVVAMSAFKGNLPDHADVILPIVPFTETSGTFINVEGRWQSFQGVVSPLGEARPGWKVLRVLGNLLHVDGFKYESNLEVYEEIKKLADAMSGMHHQSWRHVTHLPDVAALDKQQFCKITEWPIYRVDSLVRRSSALQRSGASEYPAFRMNSKMAEQLGVSAGNAVTLSEDNIKLSLAVEVDNSIPNQCVLVPLGFNETSNFKEAFGTVTLERS